MLHHSMASTSSRPGTSSGLRPTSTHPSRTPADGGSAAEATLDLATLGSNSWGGGGLGPLQSPAVRTPPDAAQIRGEIEAFLLRLPLGSDAPAADVEAMVAERLYEAEVGKAVLQDKVQQW